MSLNIIRYTNAVALEATWTDEEGKQIHCQAYSGDQMQMLRDHVAEFGGDLAEFEPLIAEAESDWVPPPPPPVFIPQSVSMRQGRLALLGAGLLDSVDAAIAAIEDPIQRKAAEIEWEYATVIDRNSDFMQTLAVQLGVTEEQMDDLFVLASGL